MTEMVGSAATEVIDKAARKLDRRSESMMETMPKDSYDRRSEGQTGNPALVRLSEGRKQASEAMRWIWRSNEQQLTKTNSCNQRCLHLGESYC